MRLNLSSWTWSSLNSNKLIILILATINFVTTLFVNIWLSILPGLIISIISYDFRKKNRTNSSIEAIVESEIQERTSKLVNQMKEYEHQAITDPLTGLLNRRGGELSIANHIARSKRIDSSISFLLADVDKFKDINDKFGHPVGDYVIEMVADKIESSIRESDIAIRWGGEEYLVCLPDTDLTGAVKVAEKIRCAVSLIDIKVKDVHSPIYVSVSIGCADLGSGDFQAAIARADKNLYLAKSNGRNRVFPELRKINLTVPCG